tara:strand:- start:115 stop:486 length:372 start_codon:yes stop_codon:yes gene_type:complete
MEYSDLNSYLKSLKVNANENTNKKEIDEKASKTSYATVDYLQRDLTLFNDMNTEYNARNVDKIGYENQQRDNSNQDEMNSRLGERGMMPGSSVFSGRNGPLQNVVLDMTPLSTRVISKDKNKK